MIKNIDFNKLEIKEKSTRYYDGYGDYDYEYSFFLIYPGVKDRIELDTTPGFGSKPSPKLTKEDISRLLNFGWSIPKYKQLFKQCPLLFNKIKIDPAIKKLIKESFNPGLLKKIEAKEKLIKKHKQELYKLKSQYDNGKVIKDLKGYQ